MTVPDPEAKVRPLTAKVVMKALLFVAFTAFLLLAWQHWILKLPASLP